ncbi:MAG: hypothetical protein ACO1OF_06015 [Adhaeribacter sp.]
MKETFELTKEVIQNLQQHLPAYFPTHIEQSPLGGGWGRTNTPADATPLTTAAKPPLTSPVTC